MQDLLAFRQKEELQALSLGLFYWVAGRQSIGELGQGV